MIDVGRLISLELHGKQIVYVVFQIAELNEKLIYHHWSDAVSVVFITL